MAEGWRQRKPAFETIALETMANGAGTSSSADPCQEGILAIGLYVSRMRVQLPGLIGVMDYDSFEWVSGAHWYESPTCRRGKFGFGMDVNRHNVQDPSLW